MAVINPYNESIAAQGQFNTRADPESMGAGVGAAVSRLGGALENVTEALYRSEVNKEVTTAHQLASQKHLEWTQQINARANAATPDDTTFAPQLIDDIKKDMEAASGQFKTRRAQDVFSEMSSRLTTSFGEKAIVIQSQLAGLGEKQAFAKTVDAESKLVNGDEKEYDAAKTRVDNTANSYQNLDEFGRTELRKFAKQSLAQSVVEGVFARDIYGAAKKLAPDFVNAMFPGATAGAPGKPNGTGANPRPSADQFVNSVFDSLVKQESGGVHAKDGRLIESSKGALGITQIMPASGTDPGYGVAPLKNQSKAEYIRFGKEYLAAMYKEFNGNADKALAAYNAGPGAVKDAVAAFGPNWLSNLPAETQGYVAKLSPNATPADTQGLPPPQMKLPKDVALAPPQNVDIPGWRDLSLDAQQKFMSKLVTDFNSRIAVDRSVLADDRKNMTANFLAGNDYRGRAALQASYARAYGPEIARRMIEEDDINIDLGQFSKNIRGRSMAEIAELMGPPPGDNSSADQYDAYNRKKALVEADRTLLKQSPVDYVMKYSTPVRQAALLAQSARANAEASGTPDAIDAAATATQRLITASLAEQRRLGVASPTILSESDEKALTQRIEEIAGSGQDVARSVDALYRSYGSYGSTVAAQMAPKIGGLMNVLGSGIDPSAAALLVEANRNKDALKSTLTPEKIKDLDDTVRSTMAEYSASLAGVPNGMNVQANYQEQISLLAMARMNKLGESQTDAVQKAYKSLVSDHYTFQDGYRVPKNIDALAIRRQATSTLYSLTPDDVALLPGSIGNPQDRMAAQLSSLRSYGRWVTTSQVGADGKTEEGLTLVVPTPGGYSPVPAADGRPLFRGFGRMLLDYQTTSGQTLQSGMSYPEPKRKPGTPIRPSGARY